MSRFNVYEPNGSKKTIYYDEQDDKMEVLKNTLLLEKWEDYLYEKWIWLNQFGFQKNHEDKVKSFLDRLGTYLLLGELNHEGLWIGRRKEKVIRTLETPMSSSSTHVNNILYSNGNDSSEQYKHHGKVDFYSENAEEQKIHDEYMKKQWRSKKAKQIAKEKKEKSNKIKELQKIINFSKKYETKWCILNTEGIFEFDNKLFGVEKWVKQYQGKQMKNKEIFYEQDKILCYKQNGKYFFFDMGYNMLGDEDVYYAG